MSDVVLFWGVATDHANGWIAQFPILASIKIKIHFRVAK